MTTRPRHTVLVRVTHWITTAGVAGLFVSGIAILLVHPRLYWGETGAVGGPSLIDLPLPFIFDGESGWGRSLHFLSAWMVVVCGVVYVGAGMVSRHFGTRLFSADAGVYNTTQRITYLMVVFVLFPVLIWTGLAMSPAITSAAPVLVTALGGQQSARTIHFFAAVALLAFVIGHVVMVWLNEPLRLIVEMVAPRLGAARRKAAPYTA